MNTKKNKIKIKAYINVSFVMEWVYENGFLISRSDTRYKTYLKRNFMYNQPAAFIHKQK